MLQPPSGVKFHAPTHFGGEVPRSNPLRGSSSRLQPPILGQTSRSSPPILGQYRSRSKKKSDLQDFCLVECLDQKKQRIKFLFSVGFFSWQRGGSEGGGWTVDSGAKKRLDRGFRGQKEVGPRLKSAFLSSIGRPFFLNNKKKRRGLRLFVHNLDNFLHICGR